MAENMNKMKIVYLNSASTPPDILGLAGMSDI